MIINQCPRCGEKQFMQNQDGSAFICITCGLSYLYDVASSQQSIKPFSQEIFNSLQIQKQTVKWEKINNSNLYKKIQVRMATWQELGIKPETERLLDARDSYCIYRRADKNEAKICLIRNKHKCLFYKNKANQFLNNASCHEKISFYKKEIQNINQTPSKSCKKDRNKHKILKSSYTIDTSPDKTTLGGISAPKGSTTKQSNSHGLYPSGKLDWTKRPVLPTVYVFQNKTFCFREHPQRLKMNNVLVYSSNNYNNRKYVDLIQCELCGRWYIEALQFAKLTGHGFFPAFRIDSADWNADGWREKSELALYGYNARSGTPISKRRAVIDHVITTRLMTPAAVIGHLQTLVTLNESNDMKSDAVDRWESDIKYVRDHYSGDPSTYIVNIKSFGKR